MLKQINWKPILPHVLAIVGFFVLVAIYFHPTLDGKEMKSHDVEMAKGMQKEINTYKKEKGEFILWTNTIFGGMPSYQIWMRYPNNIVTYIMGRAQMRFLPIPIGNFLLYLIGFYILLSVLKIRPEFAFLGSLAFAFTSYNVINIEAGHITKGLAMAFAPIVLAGIILTLRKKYLLGLCLTTLALGLEIRANHLQITYYLFLMILILLIIELIDAIKKKEFLDLVKAGAIMLASLIIAMGMNITSFLVNRDYLDYSTRGTDQEVAEKIDKKEALNEETKEEKGLDFDYSMAWSYGVSESFTLIIPNFRGGGSGASVPKNNEELDRIYKNIVAQETQKGISRKEAEKNASRQISGLLYWGALSTTSGPIYIGAIIFFLFVFGAFLVKGKLKWWILITSVLALMLAWGKNFEPLAKLFYYNFPLYNKFRVPMTLLLVLSITIPLLASLILDRVAKKDYQKAELLKALKYSFYGVGGIVLIIALFGGTLFDFSAQHDSSLQGVLDIFKEQRQKMLRADAFRSFFLIAASAGLIYLLIIDKIKKTVFVFGLGLLILIDYWGVGFRYFNKDDFHKKKRKANTEMIARPVDNAIKQDNDPHYRVMDITVNVWNDASIASQHKIIGGYHAAKMRRYQELIEKQFSPQLQNFYQKVSKGEPLTPDVTPTFNMFNTKYFIVSPQQNGAIPNQYALGNAWFVNNIKYVDHKDDAIESLGNINPAVTAIINTKDPFYKKQLDGITLDSDPQAEIYLESYHPEEMKYISKSSKDELAVFSEIFYDKGWNAYLNGELVPHFRVNYILRALKVPAGENEIVFKFEPKSYQRGELISLIGSVLLILITLATIYYYVRQNKTKTPIVEEKE